jgi:hypothetical protein
MKSFLLTENSNLRIFYFLLKKNRFISLPIQAQVVCLALKVKRKCYFETSAIIYQPTQHVISRITESLSAPLTEFQVQFPGLCLSSGTAKREKLPNKSTS